MSDIVVTVPKNFSYGGKRGLAAWLDEGDAPGEPYSGDEYEFSTWGFCPDIQRGERVYVACEGHIVGYAPLTDIIFDGDLLADGPRPKKRMGRIILVRAGGAVAVTIPEPVVGFRGWRYRWWNQATEVPFDLAKAISVPSKSHARDSLFSENPA